MRKRFTKQEFAAWLRKLKQGLCMNLEGWDGEGDGRFKREGVYVYLRLIHVEVEWKITKFCKAIILQQKNKLKKKKLWQSPKSSFFESHARVTIANSFSCSF